MLTISVEFNKKFLLLSYFTDVFIFHVIDQFHECDLLFIRTFYGAVLMVLSVFTSFCVCILT